MAFKQVRLGDYFKFEKGLGYKGEFLAEESSVGLVGIDSQVPGGGYKENSEKPYSGPYKSEHVVDSGDVIVAATDITQDGSVLGSTLMIPESTNYETLIYSGDVMKVIPLNPDEFGLEYFYNLYRVEKYRKKVAYGDTGTTVRRLSEDGISEQLVPLPDLPTQIAINEIISLIDQQIANNKALSKNLDILTKAIYNSWFVDFDPVVLKLKGETAVGSDLALSRIFPEAFVESENGVIPAGWKIVTINDLCEQVTNGSTPFRRNSNFWTMGKIPWFKTGELGDGFLIDSSEHISEKAVNETSVKLLPEGSVLMAIYASPTVGRLGILTSPATFNQACTGMIASKNIGKEFLYLSLFFKREWFNEMASGAAQQNISKAIVEQCEVVLPSDEVLRAFQDKVKPMFARIEQAVEENSKLDLLLTTLMPKLIEGTDIGLVDLLVS